MVCLEVITLFWVASPPPPPPPGSQGCYVFFGQFTDWTSDPKESASFYCHQVRRRHGNLPPPDALLVRLHPAAVQSGKMRQEFS